MPSPSVQGLLNDAVNVITRLAVNNFIHQAVYVCLKTGEAFVEFTDELQEQYDRGIEAFTGNQQRDAGWVGRH